MAQATPGPSGSADDPFVRDIVVEQSLRERIEGLVGDRRQTWLVGAVVGAIVVIALMLSSRGAGARIAPPAAAPAAPIVAPSPTALVFVDVAGAVRAPGLYSLPAGTRVADALTAAGGARARADLSTLNLAQVLVDGTKIDVPTVGDDAPGAPAAAPAQAASSAQPLVSLNSADQAALETIPGVGPVTATAILTYRQQVGAFESIDSLLDVDGIGPATLEAIRPYVTL